MNILLSTWSLQVGGGEILALNLAAELYERGHQVYVFNQRAHLLDAALVQQRLPAGVRVLSMADQPLRSFLAYKLDGLQQRFAGKPHHLEKAQQRYLAWCLQKYRIDLVHSHATFSDRMCLPAAQAVGVPLVITEHGEYTQYTREGRRDFLPVLQGAQYLAPVSEYCRHTLVDNLAGLPPTTTVYNGVVLQANANGKAAMRQQLGIPADAFVLGMAARGRPDKGWQCAIDAFKQACTQANSRPLWLVLVGGSEYLDELRIQYQADPCIVFTGRVPNPDFYLAGFDIGLLPTYFAAEALPLVIIEYMSYGKPTIATRVGGIPELLESTTGATGQLLEINPASGQPDSKAMADAIMRYYNDPALCQQHAANALLKQRNFTMQACASQYERIYTNLLSNSTSTNS